MIAPRTAALLHAAAAIYSGVVSNSDWDTAPDNARTACVNAAYALLDAIETREKANAPTSKPRPCVRSFGCGAEDHFGDCPEVF